MSEKKFKFIEKLTEKPKVEKRVYRKISVAEQIVNEFQEADVKYAKVSFEKLKDDYKSPAFAARAMGRVIKRLKLEEAITAYSDKDSVYLEKL